MTTQNKKGSGLPLAIIVIVLIVIVVGIAWLYSSSKAPTNGAKPSPTTSATPPKPSNVMPANAPPGAALGINTLGLPTAAVTIEEFADFQCPSCSATHPVMKELESSYAGNKNVRFIFRHYPLPIHDKSYEAATAVEAAGMQGSSKFWAMMDQMFTNQQTWASSQNYRELWKQYAEKIGLDVAKFEGDASSLAAKGRVDLDIQRARGVGVNSTPSVYVNNRLIPFADVNINAMKQIIDAEIQSSTTKETSGGGSTQPSNSSPANSVNSSK